MIDKHNLNFIYKQNLEEDIIQYLAQIKKMDLREAMHTYYKSKLAEQISLGTYGIENVDYKYLVEDLLENEPELFAAQGNIEL